MALPSKKMIVTTSVAGDVLQAELPGRAGGVEPGDAKQAHACVVGEPP